MLYFAGGIRIDLCLVCVFEGDNVRPHPFQVHNRVIYFLDTLLRQLIY